MIVKEYKDGNTTIRIDDTNLPKKEEEKQERYNFFNRIGCEILESIENTDQ